METNKTQSVVGKLARLTRLQNTKNGNPMYACDIVTPTGELVRARTMPNSAFCYSVPAYVGGFGDWQVKTYRGIPRVVGVNFAAPAHVAEKIVFAKIGG